MTRSPSLDLSRRQFVRRCGSIAVAPLCTHIAAGQNAINTRLELVLSKNFKGADFYAVSPDGSRMCLYTFRHLENFVKDWSLRRRKFEKDR